MKKLKNIFISLLSAVALSTSFYNIYKGGLTQVEKVIKNFNGLVNLSNILSSKVGLISTLSIVLIILFIILCFFYKKDIKCSKQDTIIAGIFTLFMIIGNGYELYGSIFGLFKGYHILLLIINIFGYYFFIRKLIPFIKNIFIKVNNTSLKENKIIKLFNQKTFLFCFITLVLAWSIYYIAYYPIVLSPDPSFQIKQFLGEKTKYLDYSVLINNNVTITNHHPVFHTFILGSCLKLGRYLVNDNFGLFIYTFIQGIFLALTLVRTILFLKKRKLSNKYLLLMLLIYAFVPIFPFYAINGNKDVYYTIVLINLALAVFEFIEKYKKDRVPWLKVLELFCFSLLLCLFRNNGVFIVLPLCIALILYSKKNLTKMLIMSVCSLGIYFSFNNVLLPKLGITGTSIRETMSVFFQQTAREIKYYEKDISNKDKDAIAKIIDYEKAKKDYNPVLADPVKNTFNKYATKEDLKNYLLAWAKGLVKHPLVYIDATLNNTYGYIDPEEISWYIYSNFDSRITQNNLVDYHYNSLSGLRLVLQSYGALFAYIPIIGLMCNIGISTWLIIAFAFYLFKDKKRYFIFLLPYIISIIVCFASPANTYFRYAMPMVFSNLLLIGLWFYLSKKKKS